MDRKTLIISITLSVFLSMPAWVNAAQESMQAEPGAQQMGTQEQNPIMNMQAKQLQGKSVVNAQGAKLGSVNKIVQNRANNSLDAVVSVGGFLGMGAKKITIPVEQLQLQGDKLAWSQSMTKDQLKQQPAFQQSQYRDIDKNEVLAKAAMAKKQVSFEELDKDGNGYISKDEAQPDKQLSDNFAQADKNADNQIDQSEFSAFEQSQPSMTPGETEGQPQAPQSQ
jgi:sporulation protein YlmC with PRC-barrel domain